MLKAIIHSCAFLAVACLASPLAFADDYRSISIGGGGGGAFTLRCAQGDYLVGLQARYGNWIDAIAPQCARWNNGVFLAPGIGELQGGTGGQIGEFHCDERSVITALFMEVADNQWNSVAMVAPICRRALRPFRRTAGTGVTEFGTTFAERRQDSDPNVGSSAVPYIDASAMPHCNSGDVAVGVYGFAGNYVDSVGLICASAPRTIIMMPTTRLPSPNQGSVMTQPTGSITLPPRRCVSGYVWREASATDHVCVTPESRDRARQENTAAASRVDANGASGPQSCVSGFVWREAFEGDNVCVTPEIRSLVSQENATAASRTQ